MVRKKKGGEKTWGGCGQGEGGYKRKGGGGAVKKVLEGGQGGREFSRKEKEEQTSRTSTAGKFHRGVSRGGKKRMSQGGHIVCRAGGKYWKKGPGKNERTRNFSMLASKKGKGDTGAEKGHIGGVRERFLL